MVTALVGLVLGLLCGGCASRPEYVRKMEENARASSLASLPQNAPTVYRRVLDFLWELPEKEVAKEKATKQFAKKPCQSSFGREIFGVERDACIFTVLASDPRLLGRWQALAQELLAVPHTGRFADDLLLERMRYLHFRAAEGIDAKPVAELRQRAEQLRLGRFGFARSSAGGPRENELSFPGTCDCHLLGLRLATEGQPSRAGFSWLSSRLLDGAQLDESPRLKLSTPKSCSYIPYMCSESSTVVPLVQAELERALRAELAESPAPSPRAPSPALQALGASLAREPDALLRDVYGWLLGLARDNPAFDDAPLRPGGATAQLFEQLEVVERHAGQYATSLLRERAAKEWQALTQRALERPWAGDFGQDFPLLQALRLLKKGRPLLAEPSVVAQLEARLGKGAPRFSAPGNVHRLAGARLVGGGARLLNLLPASTLAAGARPDVFDDKTEVEVSLRQLALETATQLAAAAPATGPRRAVLGWLASALDPAIATEGPGAEQASACLSAIGFRAVPRPSSDLVVRIVANELNEQVKTDQRRREEKETYILTAEEQRILERGLQNELAELERVEDYATYARGRAARMQASDKQLRYGRESARDRNVDTAVANVNQAATDARNWVEQERARIKEELAALGEPRQRTRVITGTQNRTVFEARVQTRLVRGEKELVASNGSETKPTREAAVAAQANLVCGLTKKLASNIRQERAAALKATLGEGAGGDPLAVAFIQKQDSRALTSLLMDVAGAPP